MLFASYSFLGFLFLVLVLYYAVPGRLQWRVLLAASYVFYFFSGSKNLLYLMFTTLSTYLITRRMQKIGEAQSAYLKEHRQELSREERKHIKEVGKRKRKRLLLSVLVLNIGMLAVVKYTNFTIHNLNGLLAAFHSEARLSFLDIALPMGISFYVFQTMGYAIDVYREKYPAQEDLFKLALFVTFFPQLIQVPISRFDELSQSLYEPHALRWETITLGLERVLWGFFKKLVIADRLAAAVNTIVGDAACYSGVWVFVGMLFYALELYADFTGGIDITIGIAQSMGITVAENFIRPYFSKNIKEYWNRWHITMGSWFTEYIFYPVSVCSPMLKLSRFTRAHLGEQMGKRVTVWLSCLVVWAATGIWHGASWNFIVWGLANCLVILVSQELTPFYEWFHRKCRHRAQAKGRRNLETTAGFKSFQVIRTVLLLSMLRTFDCYRDVPLTLRMWGSMLTEFNLSGLVTGGAAGTGLMGIGFSGTDYLVAAVGCILMLLVSLAQRSGSVREKIAAKPYPVRFMVWFGLFLLVILWGSYGIGYDKSQFIYNQF